MSAAGKNTKIEASSTLLLMRHGKSDWRSQTSIDFDRKLAERGHRDVPRIGQWLKKNNWIPDQIVCSPAIRTKQTAEHICQQIGISEKNIEWDTRIYEADLPQLLSIVTETHIATKQLLIVGHNPGFSNLLNYLCPKDSTGRSMPTAALAIIALDVMWTNLNKDAGKLLSLVVPKQL